MKNYPDAVQGSFADPAKLTSTERKFGMAPKRDGDTVTVKLAPVKITELIKNGTFMMNSTFNAKDLIIYTAPDFPSNVDLKDPPQQSLLTCLGFADTR